MKEEFVYSIDRSNIFHYQTQYAIQLFGWCFHNAKKCCSYQLIVNGKEVDAQIISFVRSDVVSIYSHLEDRRVGFIVKAEGMGNIDSISLMALSNAQKETIFKVSGKQCKELIQESFIDYEIVSKNEEGIRGWVHPIDGKEVEIVCLDENKQVMNHSIQWLNQQNLIESGIVDEYYIRCGFYITPLPSYLLFKTSSEERIVSIHEEKKVYKPSLVKKGLKKILRKVSSNTPMTKSYDTWFREQDVKEDEWNVQRNTAFSSMPLMSVVVATFNTPLEYLKEMVDSILNQSYTNWQLCIADGSTNTSVKDYIESHYSDPRIDFMSLEKNYGIAGNMNAAIGMCKGDYIGFYDHDDIITRDALFEVVKAIHEHPSLRFIYSDEDKTNSEGTVYYQPHFKSDLNRDLLTSYNYICHLLFVKKDLIDEVGMFRKEYDGAQDFDFVLRCVEVLKDDEMYHIPKILYHWRIHENSTAGNPLSKLYAYESGIKAVEAHYQRCGIDASVCHGKDFGFYTSSIEVKGSPLVSVIVLNRHSMNQYQSMFHTTYSNVEFIMIQDTISKDPRVQTCLCKNTNDAKCFNEAIRMAKGEYCILLKDDEQIETKDYIEKLLSYCQRKDVAIVGSKVLYPNGTIKNTGMVLGINGYIKGAHEHYLKDASGYFGRAFLPQDMSAVSSSLMMIKKSVCKELNSLYINSLYDANLCLQALNDGYLVVYTPHAIVTSFENQDDLKEDIELFKKEIKNLVDPYYNKNLSLTSNDFTMF